MYYNNYFIQYSMDPFPELDSVPYVPIDIPPMSLATPMSTSVAPPTISTMATGTYETLPVAEKDNTNVTGKYTVCAYIPLYSTDSIVLKWQYELLCVRACVCVCVRVRVCVCVCVCA